MKKSACLCRVGVAIPLAVIMVVIPLLTQAQGNSTRRLTQTSVPVTSVNSEEITKYGTNNIEDVIRTLPNSNIVTRRESTVDLRGLGTNRTLILLDGRRTPLYTQSVTTDINQVPISAVERIEVIKDGNAAIYGADAVSGVVNFITKKDMEDRIGANNQYIPYYTAPQINYSGVQNDLYQPWITQVRDVFSAAPGQTTIPDFTFGNKGSLQINIIPQGDFRVQELRFLDLDGNLRRYTRNEWYPENYRFGETWSYDCSDRIQHYSTFYTEANGYNFNLYDIGYRNNRPVNGYTNFLPGEGYQDFRVNFNPEENVFNLDRPYRSEAEFDMAAPCNGCPLNIIYTGVSVVFEDIFPDERTKMFGGFVNYTRMLGQNFGVTGHLGYNSGKEFSITYSKLSFLAGVSWTPIESANCDDQFVFTAQALVGILNQSDKYNNNKSSETYLTGMAGVTGAYMFNDHAGARFGAHFAPTFGDGFTSKNYVLSLGVRFTF